MYWSCQGKVRGNALNDIRGLGSSLSETLYLLFQFQALRGRPLMDYTKVSVFTSASLHIQISSSIRIRMPVT